MRGKNPLILLLPLSLFLNVFDGNFNVKGEGESKYLTTYLNDSITESASCGVSQKRSDINKGFSKVYAGYSENDLNGEKNKFVRMANFNSDEDHKSTSFASYIPTLEKFNKASFSFSYRFVQGNVNYASSDVVLTLSFRGGSKSFTYSELDVSKKKDYDFNTLSGELSLNEELNSNSFQFEFNFSKAAALDSPTTYIDIDNLSLKYNEEEFASFGDMEGLDVSKSSRQVSKIDLVNDDRDAYDHLHLSNEEIEKFDQNSSYKNVFDGRIDYFPHYKAMNRGAGEASPLGVSSSSANSNLYFLHEEKDNNSFLRLKNYDGTNNVSTQFLNYFYDNENNEAKNLPSTSYIYYSFSYRLFMDAAQQEKYYSNAYPLMFLSTRITSANKTGYIYLDNLIINDFGDMSWHYFGGIIECRATSMTAYIGITYYHLMEKGDQSSYFDVDNFFLSNNRDGSNYFFGNGTFDFDLEANNHELNIEGGNEIIPNILYKDSVGIAPKNNDYGIKLGHDASLTLQLDEPCLPGMNRIEIEGDGDFSKLDINFDGFGGECYSLFAKDDYFDFYSNDKKLIAYLPTGFSYSFIDFINEGDDDLLISRIKLSSVNEVEVNKGDYDAFVSSVDALFESLNYEEMTLDGIHEAELLQEEYKQLNFFSSQANLDAFKNKLTNFVNGSSKDKSDLRELNAAIIKALEINSSLDTYECSKASKLLFDIALREALLLNDASNQGNIDAAATKLNNAMKEVLGE